MEKCIVCGESLQVFKDKPYEYKESGLNILLLGIPQYHCEACGEDFVSIPNPEMLHKKIGVEICKNKKALLLPEEIRFLRKELYLKANEMADRLGVDKSTVSRWENGIKPIGESTDRLLRMFYLSCYDDSCQKEEYCSNLLNVFAELPRKRKSVKEKITMSLNPQEWLSNPQACTC